MYLLTPFKSLGQIGAIFWAQLALLPHEPAFAHDIFSWVPKQRRQQVGLLQKQNLDSQKPQEKGVHPLASAHLRRPRSMFSCVCA